MFLPLLVGAVLTLLGVVFRSRLLVLSAGIITLGFAILWMVRQGQAQGSLTVTGDGDGLGSGVALALIGGLLMLIGSAIMGGREPRRLREERRQHERDTAHLDDRDRRSADTDRPYGMAAREQDAADAPAPTSTQDMRPGAGSGHRTPPGGGAPQGFAWQPQRQESAPPGQPAPAREVPARETDSNDPTRGDADRTQHEQSDEAGGSRASDENHWGPGHTHRGDRP
ncbi:hypothetical protein [Streptomyces sp. NPDC057302]|uniref:hypothetical protein n=1 Tax=Streptomyces sp. NPDC057302 TaxID=3346094 RepID=UPI0036341A4A